MTLQIGIKRDSGFTGIIHLENEESVELVGNLLRNKPLHLLYTSAIYLNNPMAYPCLSIPHIDQSQSLL